MQTFAPLTSAHLLWLGITVAVVMLPLVLARWDRRAGAVSLWVLVVGAASGVVLLITERGTARWQDALPLHLCDLVLGIVALALATRWQFAYELAYFYGLAGSTQALLTPDLSGAFPVWRLAYFFGAHGAVIAAVLYLTLHEGMRPRPRSTRYAMAGLAVYVAAIGSLNALLDTNYGYLCQKPAHPSLLDWLGPWPWYIGAMGAIGLVCFELLAVLARLLPLTPPRT